MKKGRVKTESYHNNREGCVPSPLDRGGNNICYFKKGFWKRNDRKKFLKNLFINLDK